MMDKSAVKLGMKLTNTRSGRVGTVRPDPTDPQKPGVTEMGYVEVQGTDFINGRQEPFWTCWTLKNVKPWVPPPNDSSEPRRVLRRRKGKSSSKLSPTKAR